MTENPHHESPLTPAVFHILLALSEGERHGYAIMREVEAQSNGNLKMGPGTLYGSLKRLLAGGLVEEAGERPESTPDGTQRRYYRLTGNGRQVVEAEARRLANLLNLAAVRRLLTTFELPAHGGANV